MGGCCGAPHVELPTMKVHDSCQRSSQYIDLDLDFQPQLSLLQPSDIESGWRDAIKFESDDMSFPTDFEALLGVFVDRYIQSRQPSFVLGTENHRYSEQATIVIDDITQRMRSVWTERQRSTLRFLSRQWLMDNVHEYVDAMLRRRMLDHRGQGHQRSEGVCTLYPRMAPLPADAHSLRIQCMFLAFQIAPAMRLDLPVLLILVPDDSPF